jgi:hypothetical protein
VSPNRIVVILTPLVFAPAAGLVTGLAAKYGLNLDSTHVQDVLVEGGALALGAGIAFAKSHQWLKGWQAWEKRTDDATNGALSEEFQRFLEAVAGKTGVPMPGDGASIEDFRGPTEFTEPPPPPPPAAAAPGAPAGTGA